MKKTHLYILSILAAAVILIICFWDPIIDFLPIDQSGWKIREEMHYYLDEDGDPLTGWQKINDNQYYFDPETGVMHTGWLEIDGKRYHFFADGIMITGWLTTDEGNYYMLSDGSMATGWLELDGNRYYIDANGHPVTGWQEIDGILYYLNSDGITLSGWQDLEDGRYYFHDDGSAHTGWLELEDCRYYLSDRGAIHTGWLDTAEGRHYLTETGTIHTGWLELEDGRYYLSEEGIMHTGWLELDGRLFYLTEDGTAAAGKVVIDEKTYFFSSSGEHILMVNNWNPVPEDYTVDLVRTEYGGYIDSSCYDALMAMLDDCAAAGCHPELISGYRSIGDQRSIYYQRIQQHLDMGYGEAAAYYITSVQVALPGCSEHHLGLAMDITDRYNDALEGEYAKTSTMYWLMEHCWEYGFILRYPGEKTYITGITYEPWHYRYVGVELAMELRDSGLCLEEYMDQLTGDGTTCGDPDSLKTES